MNRCEHQTEICQRTISDGRLALQERCTIGGEWIGTFIKQTPENLRKAGVKTGGSMERKDNTGALFKNKFKRKDTHPDYQGPCKVNGVELQMSAWLNEGKDGQKYMSVSFQPPYKKEEPF